MIQLYAGSLRGHMKTMTQKERTLFLLHVFLIPRSQALSRKEVAPQEAFIRPVLQEPSSP